MIYQLSEQYFVRSLAVSDLDGPYISWFEDQEVCKYNSHGKMLNSYEYYNSYIRSANGLSSLVWAICHNSEGHVGNVSLQNISLINRSAEFSIIIGEKKHHGKGVGYSAGIKMLMHAFKKLNLHRVYCGTAETNYGMCKLALSLGMREEGRRREQLWLDGDWVDVIEYGVLRNE